MRTDQSSRYSNGAWASEMAGWLVYLALTFSAVASGQNKPVMPAVPISMAIGSFPTRDVATRDAVWQAFNAANIQCDLTSMLGTTIDVWAEDAYRATLLLKILKVTRQANVKMIPPVATKGEPMNGSPAKKRRK